MLTVCCSKWATRFGAVHVNVLRAALEQRLQLPHELVCVTNEPHGIDPRVRIVPMPSTFAQTPRCRRRMEFFSRAFVETHLGARVLYLDLDVVIVDDVTPLFDRPEPIVGWKVGHARVYSGSVLLADGGALEGAWQRFAADPEGYPARLQRRGIASDQAMVNDWLASQPPIATWTERDGFVTYYGKGYERLEHLGVGPTRPQLPSGARMVVLGSADLEVLDQGDHYPWVAEHWTPFANEIARAS